jgi:DNA polymerase III subunit epsilon
MREIVLDTETTGFKPEEGHRLVEIGCLELINHLPTGNTFHQYLNPEREVPADATRVHGLTNEFLADKPKFDDVADAFLAFIGAAPLVIHNATFDMSFINAELFQSGRKPLPKDRAIDTLTMARRMFPGSPASLDALCKRFNVDNSGRKFHGALLDSELLAEVYLELKGGRQAGLSLAQETKPGAVQVSVTTGKPQRAYRTPRPHAPTAEEAAAHEKMVAGMKTAIWRDG